MIPCACNFACEPRAGFRSTRNGAKAPGQTTSSIATSIDDEWDENARASCAYAASEATGCGTTLTLMPVAVENLLASAMSRVWLDPTALSPMKVIVCPPYFFLIAGALGTAGGTIAAAEVSCAGLLVAAVAMLSETSKASKATAPASGTSTRGFT